MKCKDEDIIALYCDGSSMRETADILGIAVGTVYNRLKANNIKPHGRIDRTPTEKELAAYKRNGQRRKGQKVSAETRKKISEAHKLSGIGHKKKRRDGYIAIYFPDHPKATKEGYIMEHDLMMECLIGRWLREDECVHHKNFIRDDNRTDNLQLMTKREHMSYHMKL